MKSFFMIAATLLLAMVLRIMPLPQWAIIFRPDWVALVCLYWVITVPEKFGMLSVWIVGIVMDALNGTLIGEHALALVGMSYVAYKFHQQLRMLTIWQQMLTIFILVGFYQAMIFILQGFVGQMPLFKWFWFSTIMSAVFWPWIVVVLAKTKTKYAIG